MRRVIPAILLCVTLAADAHDGHTDRAPWDVCAASDLGAVCAWESAQHELHQGTCRQIGGARMCVRNKPVVHEARGAAPRAALWTGAGMAGIAAIGAAIGLRRRSAVA